MIGQGFTRKDGKGWALVLNDEQGPSVGTLCNTRAKARRQKAAILLDDLFHRASVVKVNVSLEIVSYE